MYPGFDQIIDVFHKDGYSGKQSLMIPSPFEFERGEPMAHPCEFDAKIIEMFIGHYSNKGDTVFDPFCGTGTVMGVAHQLGRIGIGCDIRPMENIREEYR